MIKELFIQAYEKVENQIGESATPNAKYVHLARGLEGFAKYGVGASAKNLERYIEQYVYGKDSQLSPKAELLDAISKFLGFDDFEDFIAQNDSNDEPNSSNVGQTINQVGKNNLVVNNIRGEINLS